ncbi:RNA methyltransferase [Myxococcota bacterium]|nr:RNA methyltransferase [Myxococcota bacterium]
MDEFNHLAVLRTAEGLGIQNVWLVEDPNRPRNPSKKIARSVTKGSHHWLDLRVFPSPRACLDALRAGGWTIWASDLGREAECADVEALQPFPEKVAVIVGRESDGVSTESLTEADRRLYIPMHGFCDSYNLNVATGMLLQRCFDACPEARGDLSRERIHELRKKWFRELASNEEKLEEYEAYIDHPPPSDEELRPDESMRRPRVPKKFRRR